LWIFCNFIPLAQTKMKNILLRTLLWWVTFLVVWRHVQKITSLDLLLPNWHKKVPTERVQQYQNTVTTCGSMTMQREHLRRSYACSWNCPEHAYSFQTSCSPLFCDKGVPRVSSDRLNKDWRIVPSHSLPLEVALSNNNASQPHFSVWLSWNLDNPLSWFSWWHKPCCWNSMF